MKQFTVNSAPDSATDDDFKLLLARLKAGDEAAVHQLLENYGPHLFCAIRRRMNARIRERYDSQDFAQAVWASFFLNPADMGRFTTPRQLVQFLVRMASNKVIDAGRRVQHRREEHGDDFCSDFQPSADLRLRVSEPTPSQHAVANESLDQILTGEPESDRQIISLRIQGLTQQEIARTVGISERSVRRTLLRISRKVMQKSAVEMRNGSE